MKGTILLASKTSSVVVAVTVGVVAIEIPRMSGDVHKTPL